MSVPWISIRYQESRTALFTLSYCRTTPLLGLTEAELSAEMVHVDQTPRVAGGVKVPHRITLSVPQDSEGSWTQ